MGGEGYEGKGNGRTYRTGGAGRRDNPRRGVMRATFCDWGEKSDQKRSQNESESGFTNSRFEDFFVIHSYIHIRQLGEFVFSRYL